MAVFVVRTERGIVSLAGTSFYRVPPAQVVLLVPREQVEAVELVDRQVNLEADRTYYTFYLQYQLAAETGPQ